MASCNSLPQNGCLHRTPWDSSSGYRPGRLTEARFAAWPWKSPCSVRTANNALAANVLLHGQAAVLPIQVSTTVLHRTTRWVQAIPVRETSKATCAIALFAGWAIPGHLQPSLQKEAEVLIRPVGGNLPPVRATRHRHLFCRNVSGLPLTLTGQFLEAKKPLASEFFNKIRETVTRSIPTRPLPPAGCLRRFFPKAS
jgi:hypothetical protein